MRLLPGSDYWYASRIKIEGLNIMQKYYCKRLINKFVDDEARKIVIQILGKDIGGLIVSYFGPKFEFKQWLMDLQDQLSKKQLLYSKDRAASLF